MGKCRVITVSIEEDLLKDLNDLVRELRKNKVMKPKKKLCVQTLSRSEVICEIIKLAISEWKKGNEEKDGKIKMEMKPNRYSIYPSRTPVEFGDGRKWG